MYVLTVDKKQDIFEGKIHPISAVYEYTLHFTNWGTSGPELADLVSEPGN